MSARTLMKDGFPAQQGEWAWFGEELKSAGGSIYMRIDLDAMDHNLGVVKSMISAKTEIIAVVKGNASGLGSVEITRHLKRRGVTHFAVSTCCEGAELRMAGITGFIQVFGNCVPEQIPFLMQYDLTPTVSTQEFLREWLSAHVQNCGVNGTTNGRGAVTTAPVILKLDTGLSRCGFQVEEAPEMVEECERLNIPIHSVMSHFAQSWDSPEFTAEQMDKFKAVTSMLKSKGIKIHIANAGAIMNQYGVDMDFVRPAVSLYGVPNSLLDFVIKKFQTTDTRPIMRLLAKPSLVKELPAGRTVGYSRTYMCQKTERIATFSFGYGDGFCKSLTDKMVITSGDGVECPVISISMDATLIVVPDNARYDLPFTIVTDDLTSRNSTVGYGRLLGTIPLDFRTNLSRRIPKIYVSGGKVEAITRAFC